jgi:hypothetical protein
MALAVDDETITAIQAYAVNLGKVAVEDIPQFTQAVLQMSEVNGRSWETNEKLLSAFTSGATPKIRGLNLEIEKGADAHTRLNAVIEYTKAGYDALTEKAGTFEGAQSRLNIAWQNTLEVIGGFITKSPFVVALMQNIAEDINGMVSGAPHTPHPGLIDTQAVTEFFQNLMGNPATNSGSKGGSTSRGTSSIHIGSISPAAAAEIARHLNGQGTLQLAEAQVG